MSHTQPKNAIAIIDWNTSGHHATYLREYVLALSEALVPTIVLSPDPPSIVPLPESVAWQEIPTISWIKMRRLVGMPLARWLFARKMNHAMRRAERVLGVKCSRVLFGCFYENQSKIAAGVMVAIGLPAAGLYLHAGIFHSGKHLQRCRVMRKVKHLFAQPLLKMLFMLDEEMIRSVADFSGKPVQHLPDITDCSIDDSDSLPRQLGLEPKNRPVIGLLGHLRPSKGVVDLISFARSMPELEVTILLAGTCRWEEFEADDVKYIKQAIKEDSRIVFYPKRISSEASYNSLVRACDVLWAVYRDCPHSSNTLTKAAFFEKPVVVADGYLMAKQTRKYNLGEVVPAGNVEALRAALLPMLMEPTAWRARIVPSWIRFREDFSNERFRATIRRWALMDFDSNDEA